MTSEIIRQRLEGKVFTPAKEIFKPNEIPSVAVWGATLPEAWETAVLATYEYGAHIPTEYDQDIDPQSRDVTMMMTIADPFAEPRIHKAMPGGYMDLAVYVAEVVDGIHDDWASRKGQGWSYSYHDRLFNWPGKNNWEEILHGKKIEIPNVNQVDVFISKLVATPFTRRAQAITWVPQVDQPDPEPPCLQRIWCRLVKSDDSYLLELNTHWRSNDAFKAAFMNTFALTQLQKVIAGEIGKKMGKKVGVGRYVGVMDSFHIYGSYERKNEIAAFIEHVKKHPFETRVIATSDHRVQQEFERAKEKIALEKAENKTL